MQAGDIVRVDGESHEQLYKLIDTPESDGDIVEVEAITDKLIFKPRMDVPVSALTLV